MLRKSSLAVFIVIVTLFSLFVSNQSSSESNVKEIAGSIRNTGSEWKVISNTSHSPLNITKVETGSDRIVLHHKVDAKQVMTMIVTPDETMAAEGYRVGVSGGLDYSVIYIYDENNVKVNPRKYANKSGNIWVYGQLK